MPPQHHGPPPPDSEHYDIFLFGWVVSGLFTLLAVVLSLVLVWRHLGLYHSPQYQKHIVRILFMVPVYGVCSWIGYAFRGVAVYFDVLRDCYEAVVIHEFFQLLLAYIGEDISAQAEAFAEKPPMRLLFPLRFITYHPSRPHFVHYCKIGTLQYVVLRPLTTIIAVVTQLTGKFCEDSMSPRFAHVWIVSINGISVTVAMFTLVQIYTTVKSELKAYQPVLKFISIKFVIFFSFWQTVTFAILAQTQVIRSSPHWSQVELANSLNAFILCFEMAIAAALHIKAFSYKETMIDDLGPTMRWMAFKHCLNIYDIMLDVTFAQRFVTHRMRGETYTPADALEEAEQEGLLEAVEDFVEETVEEIKDDQIDEAEITIRKRDGDRTESVQGHVEQTPGGVRSVVERNVKENGALKETSVDVAEEKKP
ncbi:organic solute transporter Ostalpha-domain-containing protein [Powellomyces hirtus]|nr:organic solute transporter Ostalpha-domain-containing protein [Powellomyces hirtus]